MFVDILSHQLRHALRAQITCHKAWMSGIRSAVVEVQSEKSEPVQNTTRAFVLLRLST
ncbi:hypothetical protein TIFTF001_026258 [Ficus carica]|uniref:Uncharacterized protein n=1 Tax=Ficus carica TaxID=3494 RepID=A0AA88DL22_FICCA|nr:hypothetical protein TIFTF001_026258 [Ficus carica]